MILPCAILCYGILSSLSLYCIVLVAICFMSCCYALLWAAAYVKLFYAVLYCRLVLRYTAMCYYGLPLCVALLCAILRCRLVLRRLTLCAPVWRYVRLVPSYMVWRYCVIFGDRAALSWLILCGAAGAARFLGVLYGTDSYFSVLCCLLMDKLVNGKPGVTGPFLLL